MLTDPVYEGKSMHGMIDRVRSGKLPQGSRVPYAHLGRARAECMPLYLPQRLMPGCDTLCNSNPQ